MNLSAKCELSTFAAHSLLLTSTGIEPLRSAATQIPRGGMDGSMSLSGVVIILRVRKVFEDTKFVWSQGGA